MEGAMSKSVDQQLLRLGAEKEILNSRAALGLGALRNTPLER